MFLFNTISWSSITISDIQGASNYEIPPDSTSNIIYGGLAGNVASCPSSNSKDACNSCEYTETCPDDNDCNVRPCNMERIYNKRLLYISFVSDSSFSEAQIIIKYNESIIDPYDKTDIVQSGISAFVEIEWSSLCSSLAGDSNCESIVEKKEAQISLGIDMKKDDGTYDNDFDEYINITIKIQPIKDSLRFPEISACKSADNYNSCEGAWDFSVFPDDKKVYIENFKKSSLFPAISDSLSIEKICFFYNYNESEGFKAVNIHSDYKMIDIKEINDQYELKEDYIDGLENGKTYYFRMANVDKAQNIFLFSDYDTLNANSSQYSVKPDEIYGAIDGKKCFIATASYQNSFSPEIFIFRKFRDEFLIDSFLGKKFIKFYYKNSPQLATFIEKNNFFKKIILIFLWPIWLIASLSLFLNFNLFYLLISFSLLSIARMFLLYRR